MERFCNHVALLGKNAGCIEKMRGKVLLVFFLVDDAKSKWTDAEKQQYASVIERACFRLMRESGLPLSQLSITYVNRRVAVPYEVTRSNHQQMIRQVLESFSCKDAQEFRETYRREMEKDEVCVSFVLNRSFISYAQRRVAIDSVLPVGNGQGNEFSVVSFRKHDLRHSERSLLHELMHQFGAMDYYTNPQVAQAAERHFPGSIMNTGFAIDALTRYVIGWDTQLTPEAVAFLEATRHLTLKDI